MRGTEQADRPLVFLTPFPWWAVDSPVKAMMHHLFAGDQYTSQLNRLLGQATWTWHKGQQKLGRNEMSNNLIMPIEEVISPAF